MLAALLTPTRWLTLRLRSAWPLDVVTKRGRASRGPDPRVEARVEDVDERAHDRDEEGAVEDGRHDHGQIEGDERVVREEPHAGEAEDDLRQERAPADEHTEVEPEERHEGDQGRPQHVLQEDTSRGQSLGPVSSGLLLATPNAHGHPTGAAPQ